MFTSSKPDKEPFIESHDGPANGKKLEQQENTNNSLCNSEEDEAEKQERVRREALKSLTDIEVGFSLFKKKLLEEKMADIERETALVKQMMHPAIIEQLKLMEARCDERKIISARKLLYERKSACAQYEAAIVQANHDFMSQRAELRRKLIRGLQKRYLKLIMKHMKRARSGRRSEESSKIKNLRKSFMKNRAIQSLNFWGLNESQIKQDFEIMNIAMDRRKSGTSNECTTRSNFLCHKLSQVFSNKIPSNGDMSSTSSKNSRYNRSTSNLESYSDYSDTPNLTHSDYLQDEEPSQGPANEIPEKYTPNSPINVSSQKLLVSELMHIVPSQVSHENHPANTIE